MKKIILLSSLFIIGFKNSYTQTAMKKLDINNVGAMVLNGGDLFTNLSSAMFEVPKPDIITGRRQNTIYAAGLWIGGLDASQNLHLAASTYRSVGKAFKPGPVTDSEYVNKNAIYDKIFYITKNDIVNFHFGNISNEILIWPGNGNTAQGEPKKLAPFFDKNKNDIYEPLLGDYPEFPGDACAFTIFNDNFQKNEAMKIEVHQFVYAYKSNSELDYTIFVSYKIFNRSTSNYNNVHVGHWIDYDIGNSADDAYCSDSTRNAMIGFNGDDDDEGILGYGLNPPAMACVFLNQKLERSIKYDNDFSTHGIPSTINDYNNYLNGLYKDNTPIPSFKCYSASAGDLPSEVRMVGSSKGFSLPANSSYCISLAHVYARATVGGANASMALVKQAVDTVQKYFNQGIGNVCNLYPFRTGISNLDNTPTNINIYPNPVHISVNIAIPFTNAGVAIINIYDMNGRIIESKYIQGNNGTENYIFDTSKLSNGIYFISISSDKIYNAKFVKE